MKKSRIITLASLALLVSCGGMEVEQPIGNGNIENDAVYLKYTMPSSIKNGDSIMFELKMEKEAPQKEVTLGLAFSSPLFSDSYKETVLFSVPSEELVKTITGSSYKIEHVFSNLNQYFEKTEVTSTFYFVFHQKDWSTKDVTAFSSMSYKYTFDGEKVKIVED